MNNSIYINYNLLLKTTPTFASSVDPDKMPSGHLIRIYTVCHAVCELNKNISGIWLVDSQQLEMLNKSIQQDKD